MRSIPQKEPKKWPQPKDEWPEPDDGNF